MYLLFPGRHHLLTKFQADYLQRVCKQEIWPENFPQEKVEGIIFAVTSADHSLTQRNPLPGHRREALIERFAIEEDLNCFTYLIDNVEETNKFVSYLINSISALGGPLLNKDNTIFLSSTPQVLQLAKQEKLQTLGVELDYQKLALKEIPARPWDVLKESLQREKLSELMHSSSRKFWNRYQLLQNLIEIYNDTTRSQEGELTETRHYQTYYEEFEKGANRKYKSLAPFIKEGNILDIGSADGSILQKISEDPRFSESDLHGAEIARPLFELALHKKRAGYFKNPNTFFYNRNFLQKPFPSNFVDTTLTTSLTHELYSYGNKDALQKAVQEIYKHTRKGGIWINLDVIGPSLKEEKVWVLFDELSDYKAKDNVTEVELKEMNSYENFIQFIHDYKHPHQEKPSFSFKEKEDQTYVEIKKGILLEWLSKKDYHENWYSEMHESFCFFEYKDWLHLLQKEGWKIMPGSHAFANPWLLENRFNVVSIFEAGNLKPVSSFETNVRLICQK